MTIENTTIENCQNTSEGGGAIYVDSSTVTINSGTFKNNKAASESGGTTYWKDGGFIYNRKGTLTINGGKSDANKSSVNSAGTGDNSNMALWLMLLFASSGVITLTTQASCF